MAKSVVGRGLASAVLAIAILISAPVSAKDNGVIILRLDEGEQSQAVRAPRASQDRTAPDAVQTPEQTQPQTQQLPRVIDVPAVADKLAPLPDVSKAGSAVLMDPESGQVLFEKNAHVRRPNASTTKIMTAILLIENVGMDEWVTASKKAADTPYTSIHLQPGERIKAKDLLMGLMIRSANDAAVAIAEHIGGSTAKFAVMMNKKAKEIGCNNTNFVTPNGLYAKGHYSSAYDLCLMARYALRYPLFNEAVNTPKWVLSSRTKNRKDLAVFQKHRFMKSYPGADGIKSGYIKQAGYCYVGSATRDGWRLISAVLKSDDSGRDTGRMMDYVFASFQPYLIARADAACTGVKIEGGDSETVAAMPVRDLRVIVPKTGARIITRIEPKPLEAPITRGRSVGTLIAEIDGRRIDAVELRAAEDVGISMARRAWWITKVLGLMVAGVSGVKYGTALAKGSRRRRRRVTTPLRGVDRYR